MLKQIESEIDSAMPAAGVAIAFDTTLKNDAQRKAKRSELLVDILTALLGR
ncbi:MAG: hypothetical protein KA716_32050 [Gloeotrichia echinulata DEX184]|nr:hypothetical protein [Gloeotrichia echinulata DEX184]